MREHGHIYLSTVCLERNRWGSKEPSLRVSEWLPRLERDGFDGVELWENHYLLADGAEQARLAASAGAVTIFNSYVGFGDDDGEARAAAADAVARLKPSGVKYNLGGAAESLEIYRRNLLAWSAQLPPGCRLLCECHPGTVLEHAAAAGDFFADLDPERFGVIVHVSGDASGTASWLEAFGARVQHLHLQLRDEALAPSSSAGREALDAAFDVVDAQGFRGSVAIEFTRGIGRNEDIEVLYANAVTDLGYLRERLSRG